MAAGDRDQVEPARFGARQRPRSRGLFHKALLEEIVNRGHVRLRDAVLGSQAAYSETGAFPQLLGIYHLLGDPALRLR